jgi:hypothetical protein
MEKRPPDRQCRPKCEPTASVNARMVSARPHITPNIANSRAGPGGPPSDSANPLRSSPKGSPSRQITRAHATEMPRAGRAKGPLTKMAPIAKCVSTLPKFDSVQWKTKGWIPANSDWFTLMGMPMSDWARVPRG